jgi:hypothetical protein
MGSGQGRARPVEAGSLAIYTVDLRTRARRSLRQPDPAARTVMVAAVGHRREIYRAWTCSRRLHLPARRSCQRPRRPSGWRPAPRGLRAHLADVITDPEFLEVSANVEITNPVRPERGAALVRDNVLRWECRIARPGSGTPGLDAAEITETIGRSVPQLRVFNGEFAVHVRSHHHMRLRRKDAAGC